MLQSFQSALERKKETLKNKDVVVIASKALAFSQGKLVDCDNLEELVKKEADKVLDEGEMIITLKNKILVPNAGIDNSNTPDGQVVLWPDKPFYFAEEIRALLMKYYLLNDLGVLITDSHCQPLRAGTTGIAIGWAGFNGVQDEIGKRDLFGRKMSYTKIAVADNLASAANLEMGETNASIPFVVARGVNAEFTDKEYSENDYYINPNNCIYRNFYDEKLLN